MTTNQLAWNIFAFGALLVLIVYFQWSPWWLTAGLIVFQQPD